MVCLRLARLLSITIMGIIIPNKDVFSSKSHLEFFYLGVFAKSYSI